MKNPSEIDTLVPLRFSLTKGSCTVQIHCVDYVKFRDPTPLKLGHLLPRLFPRLQLPTWDVMECREGLIRQPDGII